jgi:hypothetical protein
MMNDVSAIATYGPYVDAMFVDNEIAGFLNEAPLRTQVKLKAKIYCLNTKAEFLAYLKTLQQQATSKVLTVAQEIYGLT